MITHVRHKNKRNIALIHTTVLLINVEHERGDDTTNSNESNYTLLLHICDWIYNKHDMMCQVYDLYFDTF